MWERRKQSLPVKFFSFLATQVWSLDCHDIISVTAHQLCPRMVTHELPVLVSWPRCCQVLSLPPSFIADHLYSRSCWQGKGVCLVLEWPSAVSLGCGHWWAAASLDPAMAEESCRSRWYVLTSQYQLATVALGEAVRDDHHGLWSWHNRWWPLLGGWHCHLNLPQCLPDWAIRLLPHDFLLSWERWIFFQ